MLGYMAITVITMLLPDYQGSESGVDALGQVEILVMTLAL